MKRKLFALFLVLALLCTGCQRLQYTPTEVAPSGELKVHFIDVGQADCILLQCGGENMLIDGGNADDGSLVISYLEKQGVEELEAVVNTHPHEDHVGGLASVLAVYPTEKVYAPTRTYSSRYFDNFLRYVDQQRLEVTLPVPGDSWMLGSCKITVLGPVENYPDVNNTSIVLRADFGTTSFLFTGDMEMEAEQDLLNTGANLKADVLKVGHHGSSSSTRYRFLYEVNPTYGVLSLGKDNSYGHPHEEPMSRLRDAGVELYRTDTMGTVVAASDGETITFSWEKGQIQQEMPIIGNKNSKVYHKESCDSLPSPQNRVYFATEDEAKAEGYRPCGSCCHPGAQVIDSPYFVPGVTAQQMADYFAEVALEVEYSFNPGDQSAALVRKWVSPLVYRIEGSPTLADRKVVEQFFSRLAQVEGMPEIRPAQEGEIANYTLTFCDRETFFTYCPSAQPEDHGVVSLWWYIDTLEIHTAQVFLRSDVDQKLRSPVILHELYQSLGMLQDTDRADSIIYGAGIKVQDLSKVDWAILRLLYCEQICRGMNREECSRVIAEIYI